MVEKFSEKIPKLKTQQSKKEQQLKNSPEELEGLLIDIISEEVGNYLN